MYEAEIKAEVTGITGLHERIVSAGGLEVGVATYRDTYYDTADSLLAKGERELRIRIVGSEHPFSALTYKSGPQEPRSRSKQEYETRISDPESANLLLIDLGYVPVATVEKRCTLYELPYGGSMISIALGSVEGISGKFLEAEILTDSYAEMVSALELIRRALRTLGIPSDREISEYYTDMVKK